VIIDAHNHTGKSAVSGTDIPIEKLLIAMDRSGIEKAIVQPHPRPVTSCIEAHDYIAEQTVRHKGRIYGLASINPHEGTQFYVKEAERCVKDLGFLGLKLHPSLQLSLINSATSDVVFQTAARLKIPVMIHTGFGVPFTMPSLVMPRARSFPDVKIVLAHAGNYDFGEEALIVAREFQNIYLETSGNTASWIQKFIASLGAHRVMMGSDNPNNMAPEIAKYRSIDVSETDRATALSRTAAAVFGIDL